MLTERPELEMNAPIARTLALTPLHSASLRARQHTLDLAAQVERHSEFLDQ
jgi:hypothetical protein